MGELPLNQILCGDCRDVMAGFPEDSVDLVVTSPPYWGLRDYGEETVQVWGGNPECEHDFSLSAPPPRQRSKNDIVNQSSKQSYKDNPSAYDSTESSFCVKCGAWRGSLGLEPHPQLFIDHLVEICREIKRVLKPSGTFWLNLGDTYCSSGKWVNKELGDIGKQNRSVEGGSVDAYSMRGKLKPDGGWIQPKQKLMMPSRVAIALQDDGWILRSDIIWHKPNHMPSSVKDRLTNSYEHVFLFAKQERYYFDLDSIRIPSTTNENRPHGIVRDREYNYDSKMGTLLGRTKNVGANTGDNNKPPYSTNNPHKQRLIDGKEAGHPKGKNPGDMWSITTHPFPGAHFATFPPKLIEPIIKAGCPQWICSECGKPRKRITTREGQPPKIGKSKRGEAIDFTSSGTHRKFGQAYQNWLDENPKITVGWSDCGCGEGWVGGVVLDPFAGSGTALRVARKLGRRFIGIEINSDYAEMCESRVKSDSYNPPPDNATTLREFFDGS